MNKKVNIRSYQPSDKSAALALLRLNIPNYFAESEMHDFDKYLEYEIENYFVVELAGQVIGAGGMNFESLTQAGIISWDMIHPEFQGGGIGQQLLRHRISLFLSMPNIRSIKVRTSQLTYRFYEKNNFILRNIVKDYWAIGFDRYDMEYNHSFHKDFIVHAHLDKHPKTGSISHSLCSPITLSILEG